MQSSLPCRFIRGFTLIEMMAVLTLTAIMAGVAVPAMQRWFDSISERAQLTEISIQFQRLASRAALLSETVKLSKENWTTKMGDGNAMLSLPDGWAIVNEKPVVFFHSGICEGGIIELLGFQTRKVKLNIAPVSCDVSVIRQ
ncbi:prepilin-type N-terminal cleavage/methylation domain-containing protein [Undibacterium sp. GrIS 1.8]|uniref:pilus assembly FimT family protein n=1 Tax=Undibacterium sp. GrIS 1.8 TaxID=3143934 RepID=UPI0033996E2E